MAAGLRIFFAPILLLARPLFPDGLPPLSGNNGAAWIHLFALAGASYIVLPRALLAWFQLRKARRACLATELALTDVPFLRLTTALRSARKTLHLLRYSLELDESSRALIVAATKKLTGGGLQQGQDQNLAWGETEWAPPEDQQGRDHWWLVCFNGAQTPEEEIHALFLQDLDRRRGEATLLVLVDGRRVAAADQDRRRQLWTDVLGRPFSWLTADLDGEQLAAHLGAALEDAE